MSRDFTPQPIRFVAKFEDGTSAIFSVDRHMLVHLGDRVGHAVLSNCQLAGLLPNKPVRDIRQAPSRARLTRST
jgi:hypothetical protein